MTYQDQYDNYRRDTEESAPMDFLRWAKANIPIMEVAMLAFGYQINKKKDSRTYRSLVHSESRKKVTIGEKNGHQFCFYPDVEKSKTDLIGFTLQHLGGESRQSADESKKEWGQRFGRSLDFLKTLDPDKMESMVDMSVSSIKAYDFQLIRERWAALPLLDFPSPFLDDRAIASRIYERFEIRVVRNEGTSFRNIAFPGYHGSKEQQGIALLSGWCEYNHDWKHFDGSKGLFIHKPNIPRDEVKMVIIAEQPLDAMAYLQMKQTRYPDIDLDKFVISAINGNPNKQTLYLVGDLPTTFPNALIINALDNDKGGDQNWRYCYDAMKERSEQFGYDFEPIRARIRRDSSKTKDWNDDLMESVKETFIVETLPERELQAVIDDTARSADVANDFASSRKADVLSQGSSNINSAMTYSAKYMAP